MKKSAPIGAAGLMGKEHTLDIVRPLPTAEQVSAWGHGPGSPRQVSKQSQIATTVLSSPQPVQSQQHQLSPPHCSFSLPLSLHLSIPPSLPLTPPPPPCPSSSPPNSDRRGGGRAASAAVAATPASTKPPPIMVR